MSAAPKQFLLAAVIFICLSAAGFGIHWWGVQTRQQVQNQLQATQQQKLELIATQNKIQADLPRIQEDIRLFERAQTLRWLNAEDRLNFSESLARQAQNQKLLRLEYGVAPRAPVATLSGVLLHSPIELQIGVYHEEQLVRFIEGFHYLPGGIPALSACDITPNPGETGLTARCQGHLFSFDKKALVNNPTDKTSTKPSSHAPNFLPDPTRSTAASNAAVTTASTHLVTAATNVSTAQVHYFDR